MKNSLVVVMLAVLLTIGLTAAAQEKPLKKGVYAHFETSMGNFTAQLEDRLAPKTVENFIGLVQGTKPWKDPRNGGTVLGKPFYDGLTFHRVVSNFIIQTGDPLGTGTGGPGFTIPDEFSPQLRHDDAGILSMANGGQRNSGSSQFFITLDTAMELNGVNSVFGHVIRGMDVVRKIGAARTRNERPIAPITIQKATIEIVN